MPQVDTVFGMQVSPLDTRLVSLFTNITHGCPGLITDAETLARAVAMAKTVHAPAANVKAALTRSLQAASKFM